ncbi:AI-2E family transporter [Ktedonospora formicarum]|uniref:AI-2E family transporter n=1 Tax=Ktedonospora formicarum TaxID=2778364 RepID=A0A8J3MRV3_9CHLR|nr:AI-2E family transporter [Ktedonospora formicarum]GHO46467.1 hypothetical protein KSX_46300 [Ktedonospora formicarum]
MEVQQVKTNSPDRVETTPFTLWTRRLVISLTILVWVVLAIIAGRLLAYFATALILLAIAGLVSYAIYPAVKLFQRALPRPIAVVSVYLLAMVTLGVFFFFLGRAAVSQLTSLIHYLQGVLNDGSLQYYQDVLNQFGISQEQIQDATKGLVSQLQGLTSRVVPLLSSLFNVVINTLVVATLSIYILLDGPRAVKWLREKTPAGQRGNINFLLDTLKRVGGGYIRGQLLLSTILSTITGIFMAIIGVPYAVFLGVTAFILSFIPVVGAFITGALCIILALTQGWITALLALGFLLFLQVLESQILGPRIVGPAVGLHPIVSLLALIAGGELFGATGALFASVTAGIIQALLIAAWTTWRERHPEEFPTEPPEREREVQASIEA